MFINRHTSVKAMTLKMDVVFCITILLTARHFCEGFPIRLWPTNTRGTEGFVEAFYNGSWGFVGNPELRFTDSTAAFLCKTLGLSEFGYGSGYTSMENYTGHSWLYGLECLGNETDIEQCMGQYKWHSNEYTDNTSWHYRYGSRLYCVDSRIKDGLTQNTGIVETVFSGKVYTLCYDGFDVYAANVLCSHLRYNGAVNFTKITQSTTPAFNRSLLCNGNEHSLTECNQSDDVIVNCSDTVYVTCRAVRFTHWNGYTNEGAVEVYYNGSWGFVGDPGFSFDDVTSSLLCDTFGFPHGGFSTTAHSLQTYNRKAWLTSLKCNGTESHIMQCDRSIFSVVPSLMDTYQRGTWLYCFDFNITNIRLVNGSKSYEGRVELEINGRWGSICTYKNGIYRYGNRRVGTVVCKQLGYEGIETLLEDNIGNSSYTFWMSTISCTGSETNVAECFHTRGPIPPCFRYPVYLAVRCIDIDECMSNPCVNGGSCENGDQVYTCVCPDKWGGSDYLINCFPIRLWPTNTRGTEGFVEAFYNGSWGFVGNPELRFTDSTAAFLCKTLGLSEFGYGSGYTSMENYTGHSWLYGLECLGNETDIEQCMGQYKWHSNEYTDNTSWHYRYGSRLYCVDSRIKDGLTQNTGIVETVFSGKVYTVCYDGFDVYAANVLCSHLRYNGAVNFSKITQSTTPTFNRSLLCNGNEHSLTECNQSDDVIVNCSDTVYVTCRAVRFTHWNGYTNEGAVEVYYNGSWGFVGDPGFSFDDVTSSLLCDTFGFPHGGFSTTAHSLQTYNRKAWLTSLKCNGTESHIMQCDRSIFSVVPSLMDTYQRGTWLYCFDFNITNIRLVNASKSYEGRVELEINGRWGSICTYKNGIYRYGNRRVGTVVCKQLGYEGIETLLEDNIGNSSYTFWMSTISCTGSETNVAECFHTRGPIPPCFRYPVYLAVRCIDIDECMSNPCVNGGSCENGDQVYTCVCPDKWGGINCEIDLIDECRSNPCLYNSLCVDLMDGYECQCEAGFEGETCLTNTNDCEPSPCLNDGSCEDRVNGYKCYCVSGFEGVNCQIDIDECQSQPCQSNGNCLDDVNGYTCECTQGYEGDRCQIEDESNNSLMVILVSASGGVVVIITLIGFCWCRHRRKNRNNSKTKEVSLGDSHGHAGPNTDEMPKDAELDGYTNLYNSVKENDGTDGIEVYAEIEDVELIDYLNPVSEVGPKKDDFGYIAFGNDENGTVQYYNLKDRKNEEYTHISNSSEITSGK